jgi:hypothetical protein
MILNEYWTARTNNFFLMRILFCNIVSYKLRSETSVDSFKYSHMGMAVQGCIPIYSLGFPLLLVSHHDTLYIASGRKSPQLICLRFTWRLLSVSI